MIWDSRTYRRVYATLWAFGLVFREISVYYPRLTVNPLFFRYQKLYGQPDSFLESSQIDADKISWVELFLEEENEGLTKEMIQSKFVDLVNRLNKICFEQEKLELFSSSDTTSTDYLARYHSLLEKGKKIGVKVNRG